MQKWNLRKWCPRENWQTAQLVVNTENIKWAICSFKPYKSPGSDGIYPMMLSKGPEIMMQQLCVILRTSLALGYLHQICSLVRATLISQSFSWQYQIIFRELPTLFFSCLLFMLNYTSSERSTPVRKNHKVRDVSLIFVCKVPWSNCRDICERETGAVVSSVIQLFTERESIVLFI